MRQLMLREIQLRELEMLRAFKAVCEANHLYYTLCGGTLLGAVRHRGFIPWDDDIDVMMPRPDFDRLLEGVGLDVSVLPERMAFISWKNGAAFPYIKLVDRETEVQDRYSCLDRHLWIDILPVDGCPEDDRALKRLYRRVMQARRRLLLKSAKPGEGKDPVKRLLKPLVMLALAPFSVRGLCDRYDRLARSWDYGSCASVGCVTWGYGPQERIDKQGYGTPAVFEFEGELFAGPSNYDAYLTGLYGDYMTLPPEAERSTRHEMKVYIRE